MNDPKNKVIIIALTIALILGGLFFWQIRRGTAMNEKYLEAKGVAELLASQFADFRKATAQQVAGIEAANKMLEAEKTRLLGIVARLEDANSALKKEAEKAKAQTAALSHDNLSLAVNSRIGAGQSWPIAAGMFSFTRPGTERTLNLFIDGEAAEAGWQNERGVSEALRGSLAAAEQQRDGWRKADGLHVEERDKAVKGWKTEETARRYLEKSIPGMKWKERAKGGVFVLLLDLGLRIAGILK
jgi:hypothetical protein